jgi:hypothetical protein
VRKTACRVGEASGYPLRTIAIIQFNTGRTEGVKFLLRNINFFFYSKGFNFDEFKSGGLHEKHAVGT